MCRAAIGLDTGGQKMVPISAAGERMCSPFFACICQFRATLYSIVEFDLKFLPVPVTAARKLPHCVRGKSVIEE